MKALSFGSILLLTLVISATASAQSVVTNTKNYRGTIGDKHIEMHLLLAGNIINGSYSYDQFRQEIKLTGTVQPNGQLEFSETAPKAKKPSAKFVCKPKPETFEADVECDWSRLDGTGKALAVFYEQFIDAGIDIAPKMINDRSSKITISYPQIMNAVPAAETFNTLISAMVQKSVKENFVPEKPGTGVFDGNYVVLLANPQFLSVEIQEYSDLGAAHPNTRFWTLNYDLKTQREVTLPELFQEKSDYTSVIAEYVASDINRRAQQMEDDEAKLNGTKPQKREEPVITPDQLPEIYAWGATQKGLAIYFDFPHVMAVFDKTIVPYELLRPHLRNDGPIKLLRTLGC